MSPIKYKVVGLDYLSSNRVKVTAERLIFSETERLHFVSDLDTQPSIGQWLVLSEDPLR